MENVAGLVSNQVLIMLLLIIIGFILSKASIVSEKGAKDMSDILLTIVTPCVMIKAYQIGFNGSILKDIGWAFFYSIVIHILAIIIANIYFCKVESKEKKCVEIFTSIYSNCGFMGIPLLEATLGEKGVLIGSAYLAVFNLFAWTHGMYLYSKSTSTFSLKSLCRNPGVIGVTIALALFFLQIKLTGVFKSTVEYVASLNTPLAMILLGAYLQRTDLKSAIKNTGIYNVAFVRLILIPLIVIAMFKAFNADTFLATSLIMSVSCPSAAIGALFAQKNNINASFPSQIVSVTTLLSMLTIPIMAWIVNAFV